MKMKFLIILLASFLAVSSALDEEFLQGMMAKMHAIGEKCKEETKASDDDLNELRTHKIPASHEGKCMIFCFHKAVKIQKEDGSFDKEGGISSLAPLKENDAAIYEKVVDSLNHCVDSSAIDNDPCLTATNFAECAIENIKSLGLHDALVQ